jgi:hypothetical protein
VRGTKELNWKQTPLSSGPLGLDAKIKTEIEANEGGTLWSDRKGRQLNCIAEKKEFDQQRQVGGDLRRFQSM